VSESRSAISDCINANTTGKAAKDVIIFAGSGVTGAIDRYLAILSVSSSDTVIVGPWEHHSNLIPYRTRGCKVTECPITPNGDVDFPSLSLLMSSLRASSPSSRMFCAFAAASNVSGRVLPLPPLLSLCKLHGFNSVVDYATAGPYVKVDVTDVDVAVFSAHKFLGGPGGAGVLCMK
jgi:selenocysteine lyase/cysteine desulfurase